ncbi:LOW QUALITY PROTEIN: DNA excision repair protein ERCC-6-like 2 [Rhinophrynus dorsalis]
MGDLWQIEDKCLAPVAENGELREAVVKSIEYNENGVSYAVVSFSDSAQKKISVAELCKAPGGSNCWNTSMFDDEDLEKPLFPNRTPPGPLVEFPLSDTGVSVPYTINRYLRDYQRDGVRFLYEHFSQSTGCILGDDMGLGKTIQVISFLAAVLHKKGTREDIENNMPEFLLRAMKKDRSSVATKQVFLIVSPLSVLFNWKDELETWGYFKITVIHGNKKEFELSRIKQGKYEIALTTYETLRLCLDEINSIDWSAVIVDEAHKIKNPKARVTQTMKDLRCKVRIGLTGTILQNNMEELWCVMDWAVPGCLGSSYQFKEKFCKPVEYGQKHNATKRELATGRKAMQTLAMKMSPWFLRRTKALISNQLPKKEDRIVYCSLSEFQKAVYQTVLETQDVNLVLQGGEKCSCKSGRKRRRCCYTENAYCESVKTLYFSYLAILRKVANHAALLQTDTSTSKKQKAHIKRVCSEVFSKFPEFVQQSKDAAFETISDPKYSGKMKVLQQLLNHCRKNKDKILLFSFSTKLLDVLERYCMASGLDYRRLDGNTKAEERVKIVKEFNSLQDVNICLVSTMAGGLGLNFVGANVVVVFDPTWNPANDLQAIDRAYRIGQCRDVKVLRLISLGTVEEIIYLRQVYKQQLHCVVVGSENAKRYFEAVQGSREHKGELFGVHNLFKLRPEGTCLTRDILEREKQVEAGITSAAMYVNQKPMMSSSDMGKNIYSDEETTEEQLYQKFPKETFDFSSDSDEETKGNSIKKSNKNPVTADGHRQLTLEQFGFSKLLERECIIEDKNTYPSRGSKKNGFNNSSTKLKDTPSISKFNRRSRDIRQRKAMVTSELNISSESEEDIECIKNKHQILHKANVVLETEGSSDESDDVVLSSQLLGQEKMVPSSTSARYISESDKSECSDFDCYSSVSNNRQITYTSTDCISDESDDIEIPNKNVLVSTRDIKHTGVQEKHSSHNMSKTHRDSQTIDEFSSSDDGSLQNQKIRLCNADSGHKAKKYRINKKSKFPSLIRGNDSFAQPKLTRRHDDDDSRVVSKKEKCCSLDTVLDGVKEVAYIHSNQNVVGSSKAENHMSRWAVRDVFELNQFSQLPANITACKIKKIRHVSDESSSPNTMEDLATKSYNTLKYPVIHMQKEVRSMEEITFLVGETPNAIRKKQFEEMVAHFNMSSAEQLAQHIISTKAETRQDMLREFYTSKYSGVGDLYPVQVPLVLNCEKKNTHKGREHTNVVKKRRQNCIYLNQPKEENKHAAMKTMGSIGSQRSRDNVQQFDTDRYDCEYTHSRDEEMSANIALEKINPTNSDATKDNSYSKLKITETQVELYSKTKKEIVQDQKLKEENTAMKKRTGTCSVTELLGDTSILDDLFSSQTNRRAEDPVRQGCEIPLTKVKRRPKDFWDLLSEKDDESLSKLTDYSVIEKACESKSLSSTNKKDSWDNALWIQNDKFLWKKNNSVFDVNHDTPGKSSDM